MSKSSNVIFSASQTNCRGIRRESNYEIVCSDLYPQPTVLYATVEGVSILTIKLRKKVKHLILSHHNISFIVILNILINMNMCYVNHVHAVFISYVFVYFKSVRVLLRLMKRITIHCFSAWWLVYQLSLLMVPVLNSHGQLQNTMSPAFCVMMIVKLSFGLKL